MHFIKLKKGIAVRFYDEYGNQVYLSGYKSKKDAESAVVEYNEKCLHAVDRDITVKEYLIKWYDEYVDLNTADRTKDSYHQNIECHIIPAIGHYKLSKLRPAHISSFYMQKLQSGTLSSTSVLYIHRILNEALKHAVRNEYLKYNPAYAVTPPRKADQEIYIPSDTELKDILNIAKDYSCYIAIYICCVTGMRLSEIAGLQNEDLDMKNRKINVRLQYQRINGECKLAKLKTKSSKRQIAIIEGTEKPIIEYLKQKQINKMKNRLTWQENNFLLVHEDGSPLQNENISKTFKKIVRRLNLFEGLILNLPSSGTHIVQSGETLDKIASKYNIKPLELARTNNMQNEDYSFKSLRHYHATWLLRNNIHPKIVSERLGHSSIKITLDTYSHMIPDLQEQALKVITSDKMQHFDILF